MALSSRGSARPKPVRLLRAALGFLIAMGLTSDPRADDLEGRAILSWHRFDGDFRTTEGLTQDYDLWYRRAVSESLRYHLQFGADLVDASTDIDEEGVDSEFREYDTIGELSFGLPKIQFRTRHEGFNASFEDGQSGDRDLLRSTALLNWTPDRMPDINLWMDRRRVDSRHEEMTNLLLEATLSEDLGAWRLSGTMRSRQIDDEFSQVGRTDDLIGQVSFREQYYDGRLSTSARLLLLDSTREQRRGFVGDIPGQRVSIESGLTVIDPTPTDARDVTPTFEPVLTDGQFSPTGIDLGLTGQSFLNVVLRMGRLVRVNQVTMYVRDSSGSPVLTGGPLDWSVYVSDDELDWVRLTGGVTTQFDAAQSLYKVTVPRVSTRFIKLVNFGLNVVESELVEVEAFEAASTATGEDFETEQTLRTFEGSVSARPTERFHLSWNGRWNSSEVAPEGGLEQRTDDTFQQVSARLDPAEWTSLRLFYQHRGQNQPGGFSRDFDQITTEFGFRPREGIDLTVQALTSWDRSPTRRIDTDGLSLRTHTLLWRSIDLSFDMGQQWNDQRLPTDREATRRFANLWTIWQMNDEVQMTATLSTTREELDGVDTFGDPDQESHRWWVEGFWRPGPPLTLTARMGNAGGEDFSADIRRYQVQWNPFRGGALSIAMIYDEDVDTATNRTFRRLLVTPSWLLNPHARIDFNYTRTELRNSVRQETDSGLLTLTLLL